MGYYDNVKDSIRDENDENSSEKESEDSSSSPKAGNFDTLREAAENTQVEDDEGGDGTPIEVLEEDGLSEQAPGQTQQNPQTQTSQQKTQQTQETRQASKQKSPNTETNTTGKGEVSQASGNQSISGDTSELEDKLDKIIEQNARMIEILEGFGN